MSVFQKRPKIRSQSKLYFSTTLPQRTPHFFPQNKLYHFWNYALFNIILTARPQVP